MEWLKRGNSITNCIFFLNITLHKIKVILFSSSNFILRNLKEYNGDLKTLHRIQEQEYDAIIDELEEGGEEA